MRWVSGMPNLVESLSGPLNGIVVICQDNTQAVLLCRGIHTLVEAGKEEDTSTINLHGALVLAQFPWSMARHEFVVGYSICI